jgi:hypothetical protein
MNPVKFVISVNMNIELEAHFVKWSSLIIMQCDTPLNKLYAPKSHRASVVGNS